MLKSGISANSEGTPSTSSPPNSDPITERIKVGRVTDIILNTNFPDIKNLGGDSAIGTIFFKPQNFNTPGETKALPFFPNISYFPLVNELVLIFKLPGNNLNSAGSNEVFYYVNSINLWNAPHHNAFPNVATISPQNQGQQDYSKTQVGNPNVSSKKLKGIDLNSPTNKSQRSFAERKDIHPLLPFPGDNLIQGRFGNSIRLGSTNITEEGTSSNEWSNTSPTGNPITIFRNGQAKRTPSKGYKHIVENINENLTSVYLTSTQSLPLRPASNNYISHTEKSLPISINEYNNPQIILNSSRIVVNAQTDSILFSSQKSINLSTNGSVNINTKVVSIGAGSIKLGSKDASESVVKGDTLYFQLNGILKALIQMTSIMKTSQVWPNGVPVADITKNQVYNNVQTQLELIQEDLETMLSKTVKTI